MTCYLVTEFKRGQVPEILNIFKTHEEAQEYIYTCPSQNLFIEKGEDKWLELTQP